MARADPDGEELLGARPRCRRDESERDRGSRGAEAALQRDPVHEVESLAGRICEQCVGANGEVGVVRGKLLRPRPRPSTPEPSVTSSSFQRSKATAAVSKPAPMLAEVAGARTIIPVLRRRSVGTASTCSSAGACGRLSVSFRPWPVIVTTSRSPGTAPRGRPRGRPPTTARRRAPRRPRARARPRDLLVGDGHDRRPGRVNALGVVRIADPDRGRERRRAVLGLHRKIGVVSPSSPMPAA